MSKSNTFETDLLSLIFNGISIANLADNAASSPNTVIWASLHTADPADAGTQGTNEAAYSGYTRRSVARSTAGFAVSSGQANPVANLDFPTAASTSTSTLTHFAYGMSSASTSGKILYSGTITPNLNIGLNSIPRLTTATTITED